MVNALSDVEGNILDCKKSIEGFDNELLNLHTEVFNRIQEQFSNLDSEISNIIDLFDGMEVSDGKGVWSKEGLAQLGLLTQQYELAQYQVKQYSDEIDELNAQYLAGRYSATEYADRLAELSSAQWDAVKSAESAKDAIMDLNEARVNKAIDGIEKEIDAYRELVDAQIDALGKEKELHDYKQSIADKNKAVADIERQIAAMQYDTSASGVAKRKKLEEQLVEAKKTLSEAENEHSIQVQEDALNKQYENYEKERDDEIEKLKESLNDRDAILAESFETVKENAATIGQEIANIAIEHGVTVSDALISSWQSGKDAIASYGEALSQGTSAFIGNIMGVENEIWNLQAQADSTADSLAWMFSTRADRLVNELTQSYHAEENLANMTNILQQSLVNTLERGYNVSSIVNSLNSIKDAANEAANAVNKVGNSAATTAPKTSSPAASTTANKTSTSRPKTDTQIPAASSDDDEKKKFAGGGGSFVKEFVKLEDRFYASGTRDAEDGLRVINEEGRELTLPKLKSGNYAIGNGGDQILTKKQTDNMFEWSKSSPEEMLSANMLETLWGKMRMPEPVVDKQITNNTPIQIGNLLNVQGSIDNANIKQMESIADKAVNKLVNRLSDNIIYGR